MAIDSPSQRTLDEVPARVTTFLRALGTNKTVFTALANRGFTAEEATQGWSLLRTACGFRDSTVAPEINEQTRNAILELDATDEPMFTLISAALRYNHPDQYEFLFSGGLAATTGAGAVLTIATMLDRLDALEGSPDRKKTRKADQAALDRLATRGVTTQERKRLRDLVGVAMSSPDAVASPADKAAERDQRNKDLVALYRWYSEWADTARVAVKRRDHLVLLGLAKRKKPSKATETAAQPSGAAVQPSK